MLGVRVQLKWKWSQFCNKMVEPPIRTNRYLCSEEASVRTGPEGLAVKASMLTQLMFTKHLPYARPWVGAAAAMVSPEVACWNLVAQRKCRTLGEQDQSHPGLDLQSPELLQTTLAS